MQRDMDPPNPDESHDAG